MKTPKLENEVAFSPFHGMNEQYRLVPTSKGRVMAIAHVMASRIATSDVERARWASEAGYEPERFEHVYLDENGRRTTDTSGRKKRLPVYNVEDIYTEHYFHVALAQELFEGFPEIIREEYDEDAEQWHVELMDEKRFSKLLESEVMRGFFYFQNARNGTPSLLKELFGLSRQNHAHRKTAEN